MKKFTKVDFHNGNYVKLKNRQWYIVVNDFLVGRLNSVSLSDYDDNLKHKGEGYDYLDVVEVRDYDVIIAGINDEKAVFRNSILWKSSKSFGDENESLVKYHRAMWNDIADGKVLNPGEWIERNYCGPVCRNNFACEEAYIRKVGNVDNFRNICAYCPIIPTEEDECCCGLYDDEKDEDEKKRIAGEIAELDWK